MANGAYTAGIARITIRPDLRNFKDDVEEGVRKALRGEKEVPLRFDDKKAKDDLADLEKKLRKEIGPLAGNIPVGIDEKSRRKAVKDLFDLQDTLSKRGKKGLKAYEKRLKDLTDQFKVQTRTLDDTFKRVQDQIAKTGAATTKAARDAEKAYSRQGKAVDRLRESEERAGAVRQKSELALGRAQRNEAELARRRKVSKKDRDDRVAARKAAEISVTEATQLERQARLARQRGEDELKRLEKSWRDAHQGQAVADAKRTQAQANLQRLTAARRGQYKNNTRASAAFAVQQQLQWYRLEDDDAARKQGKRAIDLADKYDEAAKTLARAQKKFTAAENAAVNRQLELDKVMQNYGDDTVRVANAKERKRLADEYLEEMRDVRETADIELREANREFQEQQILFDDFVQNRTARLAQDRANTARRIAAEQQRIVQVQHAAAARMVAQSKAIEAQGLIKKKFRRDYIDDIRPESSRRAAAELLRAGQVHDQALEARRRATVELTSAVRDAAIAEEHWADAQRDSAHDALALEQALAKVEAARERVRSASYRKVEADTRVATTERDYDGAVRKVNSAATNNIFSRIGQGVENIASRVWQRFGSQIIRVGGYISAVTRIATVATAALAGLAAVNVVPLIGSLAAVAKTLALLPALATAGAAAIAAIAIGGNGIGEAFKAAAKMTDNADKDSKARQKEIESAAKAQEDAQDRYENAVEGVSDAYERQQDAIRDAQNAQRDAQRTAIDGARQIQDAEEQVVDAKKNAKDAERDLARARKDAARDVRDLNDALKEGSLSEEEAALSIARARERALEVRRDPEATSLDRREADIGVRRAILNAEQTRKRNADLREQAAKANAVGIEGSDGVVSAKENLVDAREGVRDAVDNVARTREDVARANEDAAQRVADAQRSVRDSERGIRDANKAVAEAAEGIAEANEKMAEAVSGMDSTAVDEFERAMGKLSPAARRFVETARGLGDAWTDLRQSVQENLFDGMDQSLLQLTSQMPILKEGLSGIATSINTGVRSAVAALTTEQSKLDFAKTLGNTKIATDELAKSAIPLSYIWRDLATVGSEFLPRIARAVTEALQKLVLPHR